MSEIEREVLRRRWLARQSAIRACVAIVEAHAAAHAAAEELDDGGSIVRIKRHVWYQQPDGSARYGGCSDADE